MSQSSDGDLNETTKMSDEGISYGSTVRLQRITSETSEASTGRRSPDINFYQQKKTLALGMMDLSLISANASQLKYILETPPHQLAKNIVLGLLSATIILQLIVGLLLIWNARYDVNDKKEMIAADKVNNRAVVGIFFITVINVFITAFGSVDSDFISNNRK